MIRTPSADIVRLVCDAAATRTCHPLSLRRSLQSGRIAPEISTLELMDSFQTPRWSSVRSFFDETFENRYFPRDIFYIDLRSPHGSLVDSSVRCVVHPQHFVHDHQLQFV